jgi:hypothetical protein
VPVYSAELPGTACRSRLMFSSIHGLSMRQKLTGMQLQHSRSSHRPWYLIFLSIFWFWEIIGCFPDLWFLGNIALFGLQENFHRYQNGG